MSTVPVGNLDTRCVVLSDTALGVIAHSPTLSSFPFAPFVLQPLTPSFPLQTTTQDANLSVKRAQEAYRELIVAMRVMHQKCRLVHADLSEYNILYHEGRLVIIDVSQVWSGRGLHNPMLQLTMKYRSRHTDRGRRLGCGSICAWEVNCSIVNAVLACFRIRKSCH